MDFIRSNFGNMQLTKPVGTLFSSQKGTPSTTIVPLFLFKQKFHFFAVWYISVFENTEHDAKKIISRVKKHFELHVLHRKSE